MEKESPDFIGVVELSHRLGISTSALHKQRIAGTGVPYCKIGARVLYRWSEVLAWVEQRKAKSVAEHRALALRRPALAKRHQPRGQAPSR